MKAHVTEAPSNQSLAYVSMVEEMWPLSNWRKAYRDAVKKQDLKEFDKNACKSRQAINTPIKSLHGTEHTTITVVLFPLSKSPL